MRECLHVFRKDFRRYWPYVAALLALRVASIPLIFYGYLRQTFLAAPAVFLQPLGSCLLLAMVLQEDSPCDDDQFWLTLPHRRLSLLGAKALFAVAFINLPFLASDLLWFWHTGLLSPAAVGVALWRQALLVGWLLAAAAAVACITRTAMQFIFSLLLLFFTTVAISTWLEQTMPQINWGAHEWMRNCPQLALFGGGALATVIWQYRRRGLWAARGILTGAFLVVIALQVVVPWRAAWALASRMLPPPPASAAVRAEFDAGRDPAARAELAAYRPRFGGRIRVELPVRIEGIPPGHDVVSDALNLCVEPEGAPVWCTGWSATHSLHTSESGLWARFHLFPEDYASLARGPAKLRVSLALTLFADRESVHIASSGATVRLSATAVARREESELVCRLLDPSERVVASTGEAGGSAPRRRPVVDRVSYGPVTGDVHLIPLAIRGAGSVPYSATAQRLVVTTQRPAGRFTREFETSVWNLEPFAFR